MSYRINGHPHHGPDRSAVNAVTPMTVKLANGTTFDLAIPCWYRVVEWPERVHLHDRHHHDHVGWPSPNHPDHICQEDEMVVTAEPCHNHRDSCYHHRRHARYLDLEALAPIHLKAEGYDQVSVRFHEPPDGLVASAIIDPRDDWIVRVFISAQCESAVDEPQKCRFSVIASRDDDMHPNMRHNDIVANGMVLILPSAI